MEGAPALGQTVDIQCRDLLGLEGTGQHLNVSTAHIEPERIDLTKVQMQSIRSRLLDPASLPKHESSGSIRRGPLS